MAKCFSSYMCHSFKGMLAYQMENSVLELVSLICYEIRLFLFESECEIVVEIVVITGIHVMTEMDLRSYTLK